MGTPYPSTRLPLSASSATAVHTYPCVAHRVGMVPTNWAAEPHEDAAAHRGERASHGAGRQGRAKEEYVRWQWVGGFPGSTLLLAPWGPPSGWAILGLSKKGWDGKSSW